MSRTELEIGPIEVSTGREDVFRFANALCPQGTAPSASQAVPLTFPIRWLSLPEIGDVIRQSLQGSNVVLLHTGQSFDYETPLVIDSYYRLHVRASRRPEGGNRLHVVGTAFDVTGELALTMGATLLVLPETILDGARV